MATPPVKTASDYMLESPEQRQIWERAFREREWLRTAAATKLREVPKGAAMVFGEVAAVADTSSEVRAGDVVLFDQRQAVKAHPPPAPQPPAFPIEIWSLDGTKKCRAMVNAVVCKFEKKRTEVN